MTDAFDSDRARQIQASLADSLNLDDGIKSEIAVRNEELGVGEGRAIDQYEGRVDNDLVRRVWNKVAMNYFLHKKGHTIADDLIVRDRMVNLILNDGSLANGIFLDLGTGTGWLKNAVDSSVLGMQIRHSIGIDNSSEMLKIARKDAISKGRVPAFFECSADQLVLPDNSITAIGASNSLDCMPNIEKVLTEAYRVLKPGGRLIFTIRHPERNRAYTERAGIPYEPGRWYREVWQGTGGEPILRLYQEGQAWNHMLWEIGFLENLYWDLRADDTVKVIDKSIWEIYGPKGRPSTMLFYAKKPGILTPNLNDNEDFIHKVAA